MVDGREGSDRTGAPVWVVLCLWGVVVTALTRAMCEHEPLPYFSTDPFGFAPPITGVALGWGMVIDSLLVVLGGAVLIWRGARVGVIEGVLVALGCVGIGIHGALDPATSWDGLSILALVVGIVSARSVVGADPDLRRLGVALVMGAGCVFAIKGAYQVFVQHPMTLDMFEQTKDTFFESRGWSAGSYEALSYERRIRQPEPVGWFGLSNVFGGLVGAISVMGLGACAMRGSGRTRFVSGIVALSGLSMLGLSGSKGAIGAALVGGVVMIALRWWRGKLGPIGVALCAGVTGATWIGAQLGQLSLVFRIQYLVGAWRMWTDSWVLGVGPGGFQDGYLIHKPMDAPEDVAGAHHLIADLVSQLGVFGVALSIGLGLMVWSSRLGDTREDAPRDREGLFVRLALIGALVCGVVSIRITSPAMGVDLLAVMLIGVGAWCAVSVLLLGLSDRTVRVIGWGGALVAMIHGVFDLGPDVVNSAPIWGVLIGLGLGGERTKGVIGKVCVVVSSIGACAVLGVRAPGVIVEDSALISMGRSISALTELEHDRARVLIARDLRTLSDRSWTGRIDEPALEQSVLSLGSIEDEGERERVVEWIIARGRGLGDGDDFGSLYRGGQALMSVSGSDHGRDGALMSEALEMWIRADGLNPHSPIHALRIGELSASLGLDEEARIWSTRAIERSDRMALDPLRQLDPARMGRARALSREGS